MKSKNTGRVMSAMTLWRKLERHYRAAGLSQGYSGAHLLRHTAATGMYCRSKDLLGVARILRHASRSEKAVRGNQITGPNSERPMQYAPTGK